MSTGSMAALQDALGSANGQIQSEIDRLTASLDALSGQWSGEASEAYRAAQQEWNATMVRLNGLLASTQKLAGSAVTHHLAAREKVAALWR
jgi:WXG100 family type VII secretion target